jgi:hypothetical protein
MKSCEENSTLLWMKKAYGNWGNRDREARGAHVRQNIPIALPAIHGKFETRPRDKR